MTETPPLQPDDVHNQFLVSNVHPPDWANPEQAGRYNLVVVGAGTAGLISAVGAAGLAALRTLGRTIHPYPTQAEALKRVADAYNRTRLTPFVKGLVQKRLAWRR